MKLRNNKVDKDTSYFPCYRITQGDISFYIYKTTIGKGFPSIDCLSHIPTKSFEAFLVEKDTNTIFSLDYQSDNDYKWVWLMNGDEDTLLSFLFPESYLKQEYEDNAYVNINKLLNSINDEHTQDEIRLLIRGISDKLTIDKINEKM